MPQITLHHASIITKDLKQSLSFYRNVFGLVEVPRPAFAVAGAWLACGDLQLHLIANLDGSFRRSSSVDPSDWHFAFRTADFDAFVGHLQGMGFDEDLPDSDPKFMLLLRESPAGFPQLYLRDPDRNIIEVNGTR